MNSIDKEMEGVLNRIEQGIRYLDDELNNIETKAKEDLELLIVEFDDDVNNISNFEDLKKKYLETLKIKRKDSIIKAKDKLERLKGEIKNMIPLSP